MAKFKKFLESYTKNLKDNVRAGAIHDYMNVEEFPFDETQTVEFNMDLPSPDENLCDKMIATVRDKKGRHNFESAKLLYEAYPNLPLFIASDESFWAYLCHSTLYRFVQTDWALADKLKKTTNEDYILSHYFIEDNKILRNALASLWWSVKLTVDEDRGENDKYDLTKVFFSNYSLRTNWLTVVLRVKPVLHGILEFLYEHPEITSEKQEARYRYIAHRINLIGSTKELSALDKGFIKSYLEAILDDIMNAIIIKPSNNEEDEVSE